MSLAVPVPRPLPGRPAEHSPAQHVQMDVVHRLARACIHVEHSAVAFFVDIRLHSKFLGHLEHLADERAVSRLQIIQCRNVLLGHHQEMNGSLRPKILKCYDEVVLMHKVRGCFVLNDSAKKTRLLHGFNLALLGVILCTTFLAGTSILQSPAPTDSSAVNRTELLSYEGQTVSSVEVAGRPDISIEEYSLRARMRMAAVRSGKTYSLRTLRRAVDYLQGRLQGESHLAAQVKLIGADYNPQTNRADITIEVQRCPIVHARVEGAHLWPWTKHKLLPIYQQNGLAPEMIQEGRQNLLSAACVIKTGASRSMLRIRKTW